MAAPFDDQLIFDLPQTGTYTPLSGASVSVAGVTVQESGVQAIQTGLFSLVARDARITFGMTQFTGRPAEGARYTAADGLVWQFVSVVKRELANFWDITGRTFAVPGGLTETGTFYRRNSGGTSAAGLNRPTWASLESVACRVMYDDQAAGLTGDLGAETNLRAHVLAEGYREIRAGDRFTLASSPSTNWDVDAADPYDPTLGVQIIRISRRV